MCMQGVHVGIHDAAASSHMQQPRHFRLQEEEGIVLPGFRDLHICCECLLASNGHISSDF